MKRFTRQLEDFRCENCNIIVKGNGYTDHCPSCLWGKHVDINPGDRQETCCGQMKPIAVEGRSNGYRITYRCLRCGKIRHNRSANNDSFEAILAVSREAARGESQK